MGRASAEGEMYAVYIVVNVFLVVAGAAAMSSWGEDNIGEALVRTMATCSAGDGIQDFGLCLRIRAVTLLDRALASDRPLPLTPYVAIARDPEAVLNATDSPLTERQLQDSLPDSLSERTAQLDDMLGQRVATFLDSRTLQFTLPGELDQGRRRKDKGGMMMMAAVAMGGMLMQKAMAMIAILAGKALLVGKIALLLSAVIGLKKLIGGGGGSEHKVVYATEAGHGGWGRSVWQGEEVRGDEQKAVYATEAGHSDWGRSLGQGEEVRGDEQKAVYATEAGHSDWRRSLGQGEEVGNGSSVRRGAHILAYGAAPVQSL